MVQRKFYYVIEDTFNVYKIIKMFLGTLQCLDEHMLVQSLLHMCSWTLQQLGRCEVAGMWMENGNIGTVEQMFTSTEPTGVWKCSCTA